MKKIDVLIRQAQALAPSGDSSYLLSDVTILYQPDRDELPDELPRSLEDLEEAERVTCLSVDRVLVKCSLYGRTSGTVRAAVPVIVRKNQVDNLLKLVEMAFPPRDLTRSVVWIPVKSGQEVITGTEIVIDEIMNSIAVQEGG